MLDHALIAAEVTGTLWIAIQGTGGHRRAARNHDHFSGAFDADWLSGLPLPIGEDRPDGQPVTLVDDGQPWEEHHDSSGLAVACAERPRTRMYSDVAVGRERDWFGRTTGHLQKLTESPERVTCSIFESQHGDQGLPPHRDTWYSAIIQLGGEKHWRIGHALLEQTCPQPVREVTTKPGDILIIPRMLPHVVSTPADPGFSIHLVYAIDREARRRPADPG